MNTVKLIIVVPCYNEEEVLKETTRQLSDILALMENEGKIKEGKIIYVDDGSKDTTWTLIEQLADVNPRVMGLKLAHNVGHQQALWAGLEWVADSRYDAAVSIDADLQDDIKVIEEMIDKYHAGNDIVYGVRSERKTDTFFKRFTAQSFYKIQAVMGVKTVYNHADFRLMSKRALEQFSKYKENNLYLRGMMPLIGYRTDKVYYERKERVAGESKYPLKKMLALAFDGITSFSIKPISMITGLGAIIIFICILAAVYALISYFTGNVVAGWTSLILSIWFIGGVQLLSIGLVGQYIGKIYVEVKQRPRYNIEKVLED